MYISTIKSTLNLKLLEVLFDKNIQSSRTVIKLVVLHYKSNTYPADENQTNPKLKLRVRALAFFHLHLSIFIYQEYYLFANYNCIYFFLSSLFSKYCEILVVRMKN